MAEEAGRVDLAASDSGLRVLKKRPPGGRGADSLWVSEAWRPEECWPPPPPPREGAERQAKGNNFVTMGPAGECLPRGEVSPQPGTGTKRSSLCPESAVVVPSHRGLNRCSQGIREVSNSLLFVFVFFFSWSIMNLQNYVSIRLNLFLRFSGLAAPRTEEAVRVWSSASWNWFLTLLCPQRKTSCLLCSEPYITAFGSFSSV